MSVLRFLGCGRGEKSFMTELQGMSRASGQEAGGNFTRQGYIFLSRVLYFSIKQKNKAEFPDSLQVQWRQR